ncbi:hypothetical protein ACFVXQ_05425 [Kitasatospora sp. NPDC058263]
MLQQLLDRPPVEPAQPPAPAIAHGSYQCEAVTEVGPGLRPVVLARDTMKTTALALWWLQLRAERIAEQLPPECVGPVLAWLADEEEHRHISRTLALGQPYTLTLYGGYDEYRLTARVVATPAILPDPEAVAR